MHVRKHAHTHNYKENCILWRDSPAQPQLNQQFAIFMLLFDKFYVFCLDFGHGKGIFFLRFFELLQRE